MAVVRQNILIPLVNGYEVPDGKPTTIYGENLAHHLAERVYTRALITLEDHVNMPLLVTTDVCGNGITVAERARCLLVYTSFPMMFEQGKTFAALDDIARPDTEVENRVTNWESEHQSTAMHIFGAEWRC